jgi:hypothetical protein
MANIGEIFNTYNETTNTYTPVNMVLGDEFTTIPDKAFKYAYWIHSVKMNEKTESIGDSAFSYIASDRGTNRTEPFDIMIPDKCKSLGYQSFAMNDLLRSIKLGSGLTDIIPQTFSGAINLERIYYNGTMAEFQDKFCTKRELTYSDDDFVDLGLTSKTKWMKRNIGAEKETDFGLYFQWGDTVGYSNVKIGNQTPSTALIICTDGTFTNFEKSSIKYSTWSTCPGNGGNGDYNATSISAWDNEHLTNGVLKTDVDAAYVHTEGKAKMPTKVQCQELFNETNHSWVTNYNGTGINGRKFVSKKDTSKYIFIPASGGAWDGSFVNVGNVGYLWSSSVSTSDAQGADYLGFNSDSCGVDGYYRDVGQCVRGVVL